MIDQYIVDVLTGKLVATALRRWPLGGVSKDISRYASQAIADRGEGRKTDDRDRAFHDFPCALRLYSSGIEPK